MNFFDKVLAWLHSEEQDVVDELGDAIKFLKPKFLAYAQRLEEIFGENVDAFLAQAGPVIAQAALAAIDAGMKGVDVRDFAKDALVPLALKFAQKAAHEAFDATMNVTIELNHIAHDPNVFPSLPSDR